MADETKEQPDVGFEMLAELIAEAQASGMTFAQYREKLRAVAEDAERRLELAETVAGMCSATKVRKPRADKGKPRKSKVAEAAGETT